VGFNTFQPSLNPAEAVNPVANWLSLINISEEPRSFNVDKYNQRGELLSSERSVIPAFGRTDLDGGHVNPGPMQVGLNVVTPDDATAPYLAELMRYGYGDAQGSFYNFAFPLVAKAGSGRTMYAPISNSYSAQNWLEVVNTLAESASAIVKFYNSAGMLLETKNLTLAPYAQEHLNASALVQPLESGTVEIIPSHRNSIIAQSMYYFRRAADGSMAAMYGSQAREPMGNRLSGTYNLFLDMLNTLRLINPTSSDVNAALTINNLTSPRTLSVTVPAKGTIDLELGDTAVYGTAPDTYGVVTVETAAAGGLLAEMIRTRLLSGEGDLDFRAPTEVR